MRNMLEHVYIVRMAATNRPTDGPTALLVVGSSICRLRRHLATCVNVSAAAAAADLFARLLIKVLRPKKEGLHAVVVQ